MSSVEITSSSNTFVPGIEQQVYLIIDFKRFDVARSLRLGRDTQPPDADRRIGRYADLQRNPVAVDVPNSDIPLAGIFGEVLVLSDRQIEQRALSNLWIVACVDGGGGRKKMISNNT